MHHIRSNIFNHMTLVEREAQAWVDLSEAVDKLDLQRAFSLVKYLLKLRKLMTIPYGNREESR